MYEVYESEYFARIKTKELSFEQLLELEVFQTKLKRGQMHGKPLFSRLFYEKKFAGKRVYFFAWNDILFILFVDVSTKKYQSAVIKKAKHLADTYKLLAINLKSQTR